MVRGAPRAPQPRLAHVASAIGDPARAAMLSRLLDGRYQTASELAKDAGIAPSTASQHLAVLLDAQLVRVRPHGRHRYFMLADGNVAHALEALLRVADDMAPEAARWERPAMRNLRMARCCYGHLAGRLGVRLHDASLENRWLLPAGGGGEPYQLTDEGLRQFRAWGIDLPDPVPSTPARLIYGCVDWSERREHLAGPIAVALLEAFMRQGWLRRIDENRELRITPPGMQVFSRDVRFG